MLHAVAHAARKRADRLGLIFPPPHGRGERRDRIGLGQPIGADHRADLEGRRVERAVPRALILTKGGRLGRDRLGRDRPAC